MLTYVKIQRKCQRRVSADALGFLGFQKVGGLPNSVVLFLNWVGLSVFLSMQTTNGTMIDGGLFAGGVNGQKNRVTEIKGTFRNGMYVFPEFGAGVTSSAAYAGSNVVDFNQEGVGILWVTLTIYFPDDTWYTARLFPLITYHHRSAMNQRTEQRYRYLRENIPRSFPFEFGRLRWNGDDDAAMRHRTGNQERGTQAFRFFCGELYWKVNKNIARQAYRAVIAALAAPAPAPAPANTDADANNDENLFGDFEDNRQPGANVGFVEERIYTQLPEGGQDAFDGFIHDQRRVLELDNQQQQNNTFLERVFGDMAKRELRTPGLAEEVEEEAAYDEVDSWLNLDNQDD